ncbi:hypothetical protein Tco_0539398 [Tanacetum coccineum]
MSKSFEALQKHAINLELDLQQCKEKIKHDKSFKENQSKVFMKEREQYFEIQDLKAQLQDKRIAISQLPGGIIEAVLYGVTDFNSSYNISLLVHSTIVNVKDRIELQSSYQNPAQDTDFGLGGKLIQKLCQKEVYEESFSRHAA